MVALFFIGVLVVLASLIAMLALAKKGKKGGGFICLGGMALGVLVVALSCVASVPTGHTGIVTTFGHVEDFTLEAGVHFKLPWQQVINMDNRNQKATVDMNCFSSDIQEVSVTYTINYQIEKANAQTIYKTIGTGYFSTVIAPRIQEAVKSVIAKYNAENLISNREKLSEEVKDILVEKLTQYNIEVLDASIENLDFSDVFTNAVEAKQVAEQNLIKTRTEQEEQIVIANAEAEKKRIAAQADSDSAIIAAKAEAERIRIEAEATAEANLIITESLNESVLKYKTIEKWDGQLPRVSLGEGAAPLIEVPVE